MGVCGRGPWVGWGLGSGSVHPKQRQSGVPQSPSPQLQIPSHHHKPPFPEEGCDLFLFCLHEVMLEGCYEDRWSCLFVCLFVSFSHFVMHQIHNVPHLLSKKKAISSCKEILTHLFWKYLECIIIIIIIISSIITNTIIVIFDWTSVHLRLALLKTKVDKFSCTEVVAVHMLNWVCCCPVPCCVSFGTGTNLTKFGVAWQIGRSTSKTARQAHQ